MIYCGKSDAENEKKLEILSVSTFNFHVHWRGNVAKNGNSIKLSEREREWGATWWRGESFLCEKLSSNDYQSISAPYLSTCHRFLMLEESFTRLFIGVGESEMKIVKMSVYTTLSIVQWVATLLWIWSHVLEYQVIFLRFVNWLVICEQRRRVVGEVSERWFNVPKEIKEFSSVSTLSQHWSTSFVNVFVYDKNH